tara:strand:- start:1060 stop:1227 length:168 start_codon:yes stop_codon:yes gene_type:complete
MMGANFLCTFDSRGEHNNLSKDDGLADEQAFILKARSLITQQLSVEGFQEISKTE